MSDGQTWDVNSFIEPQSLAQEVTVQPSLSILLYCYFENDVKILPACHPLHH